MTEVRTEQKRGAIYDLATQAEVLLIMHFQTLSKLLDHRNHANHGELEGLCALLKSSQVFDLLVKMT
jgi:hypothetical protein